MLESTWSSRLLYDRWYSVLAGHYSLLVIMSLVMIVLLAVGLLPLLVVLLNLIFYDFAGGFVASYGMM